MKKFLLSLVAAIALVIPSQAAILSTNLGAGLYVLLTAPSVINSVSVVATTNSAATLMYDNSVAGITNVTSAYTNWQTYLTNAVTTYVTSTGVTNTFTNSVLYTSALPVAAATNTLSPQLALQTPYQGVSEFNSYPVVLTKGLVVSNNTGGVTIQINYRTP